MIVLRNECLKEPKEGMLSGWSACLKEWMFYGVRVLRSECFKECVLQGVSVLVGMCFKEKMFQSQGV